MPGKSPKAPGKGVKTPEKKKKPALKKKEENWDTETSEKDYINFYKRAGKAGERAESFGLETRINPDNRVTQKEGAKSTPVENKEGEPVASIEDQMIEHGVIDAKEKKKTEPKSELQPWQEEAIKEARAAADRLIKDGEGIPNIKAHAEMLRDGLINAAKSGNNDGVLSYVKSFEKYHADIEKYKKSGTAKKVEAFPVDDPHDPITQEDVKKWIGEKAPQTKPTAEQLALIKERVAAANEAADAALAKIKESGRPMHATREQVEILRRAVIDAIQQGNEESAIGFARELGNINKKLDVGLEEKAASIKEKEALLAQLALQNKAKSVPGPTTPLPPPQPPAPGIPLTPEQVEASLAAARNEFALASKEHEKVRKHSIGWLGRAKEKFFGGNKDTIGQSDSYKRAGEEYQKVKVAMAKQKLGALDKDGRPLPSGQLEAMAFVEKEMGEYQKLLSSSPEKQEGFIQRMWQGYATMPKKYRIPLTFALTTAAAAGVVGLSGGGFAAAMGYAGYRVIKGGALLAGSTAVTETYGALRNKKIKDRQDAERAGIGRSLSATGGMEESIKRLEALAGERKKFNTQTGWRKALIAGALGGGTGLYTALDSFHGPSSLDAVPLEPATPAAKDYSIFTGPHATEAGIDPRSESVVPQPPSDNYADNPPVQEGAPSDNYADNPPTQEGEPSDNYADNPPTEAGKVPSESPSLAEGFGEEPFPPAQGLGEEPLPPAQGFGDAKPLTPEPSDNYADNPPTEMGKAASEPPASKAEGVAVSQPKPPSEPITVTAGDAKKGLWGILERKALADGVISERTPIADKNSMIASMENQLRALSPQQLQELGFRPSRGGVVSIDVIRPGERLNLSMTDPENWKELGSKSTGAPAAAPIQTDIPTPPARPAINVQPDAPTPGIKSDVPLPPTRPSLEVPTDMPAPRASTPLNITPDLAPSGSQVAENIATANTAEAITQSFTPENVKGAWPLLAKGIMSRPEDVTSNYYGTMNFKGLGLTFNQYKWLNNELIAARDTYKISFDNNKLVGKVLEELAQKRSSGGKVLTA